MTRQLTVAFQILPSGNSGSRHGSKLTLDDARSCEMYNEDKEDADSLEAIILDIANN